MTRIKALSSKHLVYKINENDPSFTTLNKKVKTGSVHIPLEDFDDANITAHISIRLPLNLVKDLKRLALTEEYEGRYQVLIKKILSGYVEKSVSKKRASA